MIDCHLDRAFNACIVRNLKGGSPGLVVMGGEVVGSNPGTVYWRDIFHIYLL